MEDMPFSEALQRLAGVDPREIKREMEATKKESQKVEKSVQATEESIERGARRSRHKFRL